MDRHLAGYALSLLLLLLLLSSFSCLLALGAMNIWKNGIHLKTCVPHQFYGDIHAYVPMNVCVLHVAVSTWRFFIDMHMRLYGVCLVCEKKAFHGTRVCKL